MTTRGKREGLRRISDPSGGIRILAVDQVRFFTEALRKRDGLEPDRGRLRDCCAALLEGLASEATGVILHPAFSAFDAVCRSKVPEGTGTLVRLEESQEAGRTARLEAGLDIGRLKAEGLSAAKLLLYMDPQDRTHTSHQLGVLGRVGESCASSDLLLLVELLPFRRAGEDPARYAARFPEALLAAVRLAAPQADVLKLPFPVDLERAGERAASDALLELEREAGRPWVLLSAGIGFDLFRRQTELACAAGARGFAAGRAIFREYFDGSEGEAFLASAGRSRMRALAAAGVAAVR